MATALQASQVRWVTKGTQESQAEWKAAEDLQVRKETEVFQVCILENKIYLLFLMLLQLQEDCGFSSFFLQICQRLPFFWKPQCPSMCHCPAGPLWAQPHAQCFTGTISPQAV